MNNLLKRIAIGSAIVGFAAISLPAFAGVVADKTTETDCTNASYYWYKDACYETQVEALTAQIADLLTTVQALQTQLSTLQGTTPTTPTASTYSGVPSDFTFTKNLYKGMKDQDVVYLKKVLDVEVPDHASWSGSNYFGSKTKAAVVAFQNRYKDEISGYAGYTIKGSGFVGKGTRTELNALLSAATTPTTPSTPSTPSTTTTPSTPATTTTPAAAGLTVELADDNPASATIVADSTSAGDGAQSMIPVLKLKFTNGDASDVKVTQINFKRSGISADSDISQAYLYDGDTNLAEYNSFSSAVLAFSNSAGLFTVPAGESKTVTLKVDLADGTASGKTVRFGVDSSSDIASDASAVNGTFPMTGNYMSTATTGDLGKLTVTDGTDPSSYVDPQNGFEVFNFTLAGADQKIEVRKLKFTNIGSTAYTDLTNFKLYDGGTQVGDTIASMDSDKTVTFDLSGNPLVIDKGVTKTMHLKADIVGGTNRTFRFTIQNMTDVVAYDTQYGVYIKPNQSDSWTVIEAGNTSTINTGKLTISRASDTPSGNVPLGGTNITTAKFDLKATGEDVKITAMGIAVYGSIGATGLYQGKLYFDGAQKGTTDSDVTSATTSAAAATNSNSYSFGNTFIVPADGQTHTLTYVADMKTGSGGTQTANTNFTVKITSTTAQGKTSLASVSVGTASGYQLTIASGALNTALNQAVSSWTSNNPTGVPGATDVLVGSFGVTAGAAEGADITAVQLQYVTSTNTVLQNLKVYNGTKDSGTQIGTTQSSVTASTTYTFYPSPYVSLDKSQSITLNVYADILTGSATGSQGYIKLGTVSGTGKTTNTAVNSSSTVTGQTIYVDSAGSLDAAAASDQPKSAQVIMGTTGVEFNKIKFTAGAGEAIDVTQVVVTATLGNDAPTSTVKNISLWDGTTQIGSTVASLAAAGTATFDLTSNPWVIPAAGEKTLTIKADVNNYAYATSSGSVALGLATSTGVTYKGEVSGTSGSGVPSLAVLGNAMHTYKTTVSVDKNSDSPTTAFRTSNQDVLYFDVTNNGSYDAYFNVATFTVAYTQGTGLATTSEARNFRLYESSDLTTYIASTTISASTSISNMPIALTVTNPSGGYVIPAGTTKTFHLVGDLSDCGGTSSGSSGSQIRFDITTGVNFNWDDAMSDAVQSTYTKTFPLYGNVLSW